MQIMRLPLANACTTNSYSAGTSEVLPQGFLYSPIVGLLASEQGRNLQVWNPELLRLQNMYGPLKLYTASWMCPEALLSIALILDMHFSILN